METTPDTSAQSRSQTPNADNQASLLRGPFGSRLRQHPREDVDFDVFLAPVTGAGPLVARGNCLDISRGGLRAEIDAPCGVAEVYQVVVSKGDGSAVEPRFARCLRCAIATDGRFEASFQFLVPVELPRLGR